MVKEIGIRKSAANVLVIGYRFNDYRYTRVKPQARKKWDTPTLL